MMIEWMALLMTFSVPQEAPSTPQPTEAAVEYGPYFVFFGFDSSAIDRDGDAILIQVVEDYRSAGNAPLTLTGHTDRAGASAYNQRLSKRRVDAVRDRLIALGVAPSHVTIGPDGEGEPLIETADGVREAQNRRVEIHFD
ncbi:OmpA family protein [Sphingomicrobium clamense]|uniref:OmpA family protein n=1 Tax=Sphingomicrobium clamense TaxID=2851013 RepID=A0ABS6V7E6_9SPHN|nr:OmpA family protein [Sphingomicrobium sp. B8]MBW0145497.1 OmpA family protein [Sphingomicrobium sp. B8]